jgi:hypothetical protein
MASKPAQAYPGDAGSLATNPEGRVFGAIVRHGTRSRTYEAPAARARANAASYCDPPKREGSARPVLRGAVREVEYVRNLDPPARIPDAVNAARNTIAPNTVRWRAVTPNTRNTLAPI